MFLLAASKLSPKKSGIQGPTAIAVFLLIGALSFGNINELTFIRPLLTSALTLGLLDALFLGGAAFGQVMMIWPGYRRRVLIHEAGHVVAAYLLGCPVRGVVLDAVQALQMGIRGQVRGSLLSFPLADALNPFLWRVTLLRFSLFVHSVLRSSVPISERIQRSRQG